MLPGTLYFLPNIAIIPFSHVDCVSNFKQHRYYLVVYLFIIFRRLLLYHFLMWTMCPIISKRDSTWQFIISSSEDSVYTIFSCGLCISRSLTTIQFSHMTVSLLISLFFPPKTATISFSHGDCVSNYKQQRHYLVV